MILRAYSLYDEKAGVFSPPFYMGTEGLALRAVSDLVADERTTVARHPNDFILYELGAFDDSTGVIEGAKPRPLVKASSLLPQQPSLPLQAAAE